MTRRTALTTLAAVTMALASAPVAAAAAGTTLTVYPTEVRPGAVFGTGFHGGCDTYSSVTSPGFTAPVSLVAVGGDRNNLWGNGTAVTTPGTYTATGTCDGKTLTTRFTVLPHQPPSWGLYPLEVQPGGEISGGSDTITGCPGGAEGPATSPGFAEPLRWTRGGNFGRFSGTTTVITTPGKYTATLKCKGTPIIGEIQFTIIGTPPTGTPPATNVPAPGNGSAQPAGRTPIIKPKGAPQTGGGGTAG
ncbi:hypothetical protein [Amycolatopsis samaneae]|uniref:Ig-like domain-containing protein n=1 Tax=Amycolatopsis samaneae TaxID=664691 RepID=A0ABW5GDV8_9PSEU